MKRLRQLVSGRSLVIAAPFAFLLVFFLLPFLIVGRISVSEMDNVVFKDLITYQEGVLALADGQPSDVVGQWSQHLLLCT